MNTVIRCSTSLNLFSASSRSVQDWSAHARLLERGGFDLVRLDDEVDRANDGAPSATALAAVDGLLAAGTGFELALSVPLADADPQRWAEHLTRLNRLSGGRVACALEPPREQAGSVSRARSLSLPRAEVFVETLKEHGGVHAGKAIREAGHRVPVLASVQGSARDKAFAARHAQAAIVSGKDVRQLTVDIADLRLLGEEMGRGREPLASLLAVEIVTARSSEEAQVRQQRIHDQQQWLRNHANPNHGRNDATASVLRAVGTPDVVTRQLLQWVDATEAAGIHVLELPEFDLLPDFVNRVVPELQARGRYRSDRAPELWSGHRDLGQSVSTSGTTPPPIRYLLTSARRAESTPLRRARPPWVAFLRH